MQLQIQSINALNQLAQCLEQAQKFLAQIPDADYKELTITLAAKTPNPQARYAEVLFSNLDQLIGETQYLAQEA